MIVVICLRFFMMGWFETTCGYHFVKMSSDLPPLAKVKYFQSHIPSYDYIKGISVLQVQNVHDLDSPLLGVRDYDKCCPCDKTMEECGGHIGHLELPIPVFNVFYTKNLVNILNCVCLHCVRLRLPRDTIEYEHIYNLPFDQRLNALAKASKSYKVCGCTCGSSSCKCEDFEDGCGLHVPRAETDDKFYIFLRVIIPLSLEDMQEYEQNPRWKPFSCSPTELFYTLKMIGENDEMMHMLGCNNYNAPASQMWKAFPVSSHNTRPKHKFGGMGGTSKKEHNDWTKFQKDIITAYMALMEECRYKSVYDINICSYEFKGIQSLSFKTCFSQGFATGALKKNARKNIKSDEQIEKRSMSALETAWHQLSYIISGFISSRCRKLAHTNSYSKVLANAESRLSGQKSGRFRTNIIANRIDNAGRAVLGGCTYIKPYECMVPKAMAMILTFPEKVTELNMSLCQRYILNGCFKYPGANEVVLKDGREINLQYMENRRDIAMEDVYIVHRHLITGDDVMVGRQPTLHRPSQMSFKAIINIMDPEDYRILLHYAVFPPMAADCDGDEVNLEVPNTYGSLIEHGTLMGVQENIMKDGGVSMQFILNAVTGLAMLSQTRFFNRTEMMNICQDRLLISGKGYPIPAIIKPSPLWTGKQLLNVLLPDDFVLIQDRKSWKNPHHLNIDQDDMIIYRGQFIVGHWTKSNLVGAKGVLNTMARQDSKLTLDFIHDGYRMAQYFLDQYGVSASLDDCVVDVAYMNDKIKYAFQEAAEVRHKVSSYVDTFPNHVPNSSDYTLENNIKLAAEKITQAYSKAVTSYIESRNPESNGLYNIVQSGSKGSMGLFNQMGGVMGQVHVMFKRFPCTTSHFRKGQDSLEAYGYTFQNCGHSLDLCAIMSQGYAAIESTMQKNKGTARPGEIMRKITCSLKGVVTNHMGQVVNSRNQIIWEQYGNDRCDPSRLTASTIRLTSMDEKRMVMKYGILFNPDTLVWSKPGESQWKDIRHGKDGKLSQWFFSNKRCSETILYQDNGLEKVLTPTASKRWNMERQRLDVQQAFHKNLHLLCGIRLKLRAMMRRSGMQKEVNHIRTPFSFQSLLDQIQSKHMADKSDLTPMDVLNFVQSFWAYLSSANLIHSSNLSFQALFLDWCSIRYLLIQYHVTRDFLTMFGREMEKYIIGSRVAGGEAVGVLCAGCLGEPFTQSVLKAPHFAGMFKHVLSGPERMESLVYCSFKNPQMRVVLNHNVSQEKEAIYIAMGLVQCHLVDIMTGYPSFRFDRDMSNGSKHCILTFPIDKTKSIGRAVSLRKLVKNIIDRSPSDRKTNDGLHCSMFSIPYFECDDWTITLRLDTFSWFWNTFRHSDDQDDIAYDDSMVASILLHNISHQIVISGLSEIKNFTLEKVNLVTLQGHTSRWVIHTQGSNLEYILQLKQVDSTRTTTTDINEMCNVLGLFAAQKALFYAFVDVLPGSIDKRHIKVLVRAMTSDMMVRSVAGSGVNYVAHTTPPLQRAAYHQTVKTMIRFTSHAERDDCSTICGAALANSVMKVGAGYRNRYMSDPIVFSTRKHLLPPTMKSYVFSPKADGYRVCMTFCKDRKGNPRITITNRKNEVYPLPVITQLGFQGLYEGTVLDGELLKINENQHCFMIFDALVVCGNRCSVLRYDQRIEIARTIVHQFCVPGNTLQPIYMGMDLEYALPSLRPHVSKSIATPQGWNIGICVKPVFQLEGLSHFHEHVMPKLSFEIDGYTFTHISLPAYPFRMETDSIFKWKPRKGDYSSHTIDFLVYPMDTKGVDDLSCHTIVDPMTPETLKPFQCLEGNVKLVAHHTVYKPKYKRYQITFSMGFADTRYPLSFGKVYECVWNIRRNQWEIVRQRDKNCNQFETVVRTVQNIIEDIQPSEIGV